MAIIIKKDNLMENPEIKLINDNKIKKVSFDENLISIEREKTIFSKSITCWSLPENENKYVFNEQDKDGIKLYKIQRTETESGRTYNVNYYFGVIDLDINADFYFAHNLPFNNCRFKININDYSNDQDGEIVQDNHFSELKLTPISVDEDEKGGLDQFLYTTFTAPTDDYFIQKIPGITPFIPIWVINQPEIESNNVFYDKLPSKLYVYLGRNSISEQFVFATISFDLEIIYDCYKEEKVVVDIGDGINSYKMETNSFMNIKSSDYGTNNDFIKNQAANILDEYTYGKMTCNVTCNYGKYYNDDGTVAYSGTNGETLKVGDIVQLELEGINKNFVVLKSEITGVANTRVNLSLEEYEDVYGINENAPTSATITYTRVSSTHGAATGQISRGTKLYNGDVIKIELDYDEDNYRLQSFIVENSPFTSGNTITVNNENIDVFVELTQILGIVENLTDNITVTYTRTSSPGGGTIGVITPSSEIYLEDVIKIDYSYNSTVYNLDFFNVGGYPFESGSSVTVDRNVLVNGSVSVKTYQLNYNVDSGSYLRMNRVSSTYGGGQTGYIPLNSVLYYDDLVNFDFGANEGYTLETHTINGEILYPSTSYYIRNDKNIVISSYAQQWHTILDQQTTISFDTEPSSADVRYKYINITGIKENAPMRVTINFANFIYWGGSGVQPIEFNISSPIEVIVRNDPNEYVAILQANIDDRNITSSLGNDLPEISGVFGIHRAEENNKIFVQERPIYINNSTFGHFNLITIRKIEQFY